LKHIFVAVGQSTQHAGPAAKATHLLTITCPEDNGVVNYVFGWAKFFGVSDQGTFCKPPHFAFTESHSIMGVIVVPPTQ
jgi:hypothetical protein